MNIKPIILVNKQTDTNLNIILMVGHKLSIAGLRDESFFFMGFVPEVEKLQKHEKSNAKMKAKGKLYVLFPRTGCLCKIPRMIKKSGEWAY